jgi:hypothetical protein
MAALGDFTTFAKSQVESIRPMVDIIRASITSSRSFIVPASVIVAFCLSLRL